MFKFKGGRPTKAQAAARATITQMEKIILNPKAKPADVLEANRLIETLKSVAGVIGESDRPSQTGTTQDIVYSAPDELRASPVSGMYYPPECYTPARLVVSGVCYCDVCQRWRDKHNLKTSQIFDPDCYHEITCEDEGDIGLYIG